jgi:hypothetical protein
MVPKAAAVSLVHSRRQATIMITTTITVMMTTKPEIYHV